MPWIELKKTKNWMLCNKNKIVKMYAGMYPILNMKKLNVKTSLSFKVKVLQYKVSASPVIQHALFMTKN